jgi:hypothetical protein
MVPIPADFPVIREIARLFRTVTVQGSIRWKYSPKRGSAEQKLIWGSRGGPTENRRRRLKNAIRWKCDSAIRWQGIALGRFFRGLVNTRLSRWVGRALRGQQSEEGQQNSDSRKEHGAASFEGWFPR